MSSEKAFVMNSLLRSVVTDGTARQLQSLGVTLPAAGKTGTTNDCRDAWFVGYTPDILCLVWVGFDDGRSIKSTGASAAVPIWADLMQAIPHCLSGSWYAKPAGVVELDLCTQSHARAGAHCPNRYTEVFLADKPPADYCGLHRKSGLFHTVIKGINRLFGR